MTDTVTAHALVGLFGVTIRTITDQAKRGIIVRAAIGDPSRTTILRDCRWLDRQTGLSTSTEPKAVFPALANRAFSASGAGYRDRPLSFQWQAPLVLVEGLGLTPARNRAYGATIRMIPG